MATLTTTDVRADIRRADDAFEKQFSEGNAAGIAELYTSNAMLLPPGSDPMQGKQAIRDFWQGAMNMGIRQVKLEIMDVEPQGDSIIEVGHYQLKGAGDEVMDWGKYLVIWKQEDGNWKLHRDIWNTSRPA